MKKLAIVLLMGLAIGMTFMSCTPEDQCGTVTGWDIDRNGNEIVYIDGTSHHVMFSVWINAEVGDYLCIEY